MNNLKFRRLSSDLLDFLVFVSITTLVLLAVQNYYISILFDNRFASLGMYIYPFITIVFYLLYYVLVPLITGGTLFELLLGSRVLKMDSNERLNSIEIKLRNPVFYLCIVAYILYCLDVYAINSYRYLNDVDSTSFRLVKFFNEETTSQFIISYLISGAVFFVLIVGNNVFGNSSQTLLDIHFENQILNGKVVADSNVNKSVSLRQRRIFAFLIDALIFLFLSCISIVTLDYLFVNLNYNYNESMWIDIITYLEILSPLIIFILYYVVYPYRHNGATVAKKYLKITMIREYSEVKIDLFTLVLCNPLFYSLLVLSVFCSLQLAVNRELVLSLFTVFYFVNIIIVLLLKIITLALGNDQQCKMEKLFGIKAKYVIDK